MADRRKTKRPTQGRRDQDGLAEVKEAVRKRRTPRTMQPGVMDPAVGTGELAEMLMKIDQDNREILERLARLEELGQSKSERVQARAENGARLIKGRQAKRAVMTLDEWESHCMKTGHSPYKMDKSIENHSRGSLSTKESPQLKRHKAKMAKKK